MEVPESVVNHRTPELDQDRSRELSADEAKGATPVHIAIKPPNESKVSDCRSKVEGRSEKQRA